MYSSSPFLFFFLSWLSCSFSYGFRLVSSLDRLKPSLVPLSYRLTGSLVLLYFVRSVPVLSHNCKQRFILVMSTLERPVRLHKSCRLLDMRNGNKASIINEEMAGQPVMGLGWFPVIGPLPIGNRRTGQGPIKHTRGIVLIQ